MFKSFLTSMTVVALIVSGSAFANPTSIYSLYGDWPSNQNKADNSSVSNDKSINPHNVKSLQKAWTIQYPSGGVDSTPSISNGKVYFADGAGGVTAADQDTGQVNWHVTLSANGHSEGFITTPVITKSFVFVAQDNMFKLDRNTGKIIWSVPVYDLIGSMLNPPASMGVSQLMIAGDKVVVGIGFGDEGPGLVPDYIHEHGEVIAVNQDTGNIDWRLDTTMVNGVTYGAGGGSFGEAAVDDSRHTLYIGMSNQYTSAPGTTDVTSPYADALVAIDYNTGKVIWYYQFYAHDVWSQATGNPSTGTSDLDVRGHPQLFTLTNSDGSTTDYVSVIGKDGSVRVFPRDPAIVSNSPIVQQPVVQVQLGPAATGGGGIQIMPALNNNILYVATTAAINPFTNQRLSIDYVEAALGGGFQAQFAAIFLFADTHVIALDLNKLVAYGKQKQQAPGSMPICYVANYGPIIPPLCDTSAPTLPLDQGIVLYDVDLGVGNLTPLNSSGMLYDNGVLFLAGWQGAVIEVNAATGQIINVIIPAPGPVTAIGVTLPNYPVLGGVSSTNGKIYIPYGVYDYAIGGSVGNGGIIAYKLP